MILFLIISWWLAGLVGGFLLWRDWKLNFPRGFGRCPSRKGALAIALVGTLGPIILLTGGAVALIWWLDNRPKSPPSKWSAWWNEPIC